MDQPHGEENKITPRAPVESLDTEGDTPCAERVSAPSYELVPCMHPCTSHCGQVVDSHATPCFENRAGRPTQVLAGVDLEVRFLSPLYLVALGNVLEGVVVVEVEVPR